MAGHIDLLEAYGALLNTIGADEKAAGPVKVLQKGLRDDIPKLSEIILSAGAVPPRDSNPPKGDDVESLLRAVDKRERSLRRDLEEQLKLKHHLRTIAVLNTLLAGAERRIGDVQTMAKQLSIPIS